MRTKITGKNYQGTTCHLVRAVNMQQVYVGDKIRSNRGEVHTAIGGSAPHKPSSSGKVYVEGAEYYPSVFGLIWF